MADELFNQQGRFLGHSFKGHDRKCQKWWIVPHSGRRLCHCANIIPKADIMKYFRYMYDLPQRTRSFTQLKFFGGGGGVILPEEIKALMDYGIARIYSPDDG